MTLTIVERTEPGEIAAYDVPDTWPLLTAAQVEQHAPDMSLVCLAEESVVARCSLWWTATPTLESQHVGAIGHYAALNSEAASMLLNAACDILQRHGCAVAVGPMDGNTWRSYRLVVDVGTEPPFFMEPTNPPSYPGHFESTSFAPLADYMLSLIHI